MATVSLMSIMSTVLALYEIPQFVMIVVYVNKNIIIH